MSGTGNEFRLPHAGVARALRSHAALVTNGFNNLLFINVLCSLVTKFMLNVVQIKLISSYPYKDNPYTDKCQEIIIVVGYPQNVGYEA